MATSGRGCIRLVDPAQCTCTSTRPKRSRFRVSCSYTQSVATVQDETQRDPIMEIE